jgi:hypothetical protein
MRYTVAAESWPSRGRFPITDETGTVQFTLVRNSLRDTSGLELAVIQRRRFRSETDIRLTGQAPASVRPEDFGHSYDIICEGDVFTATRDSSANTYTVTHLEGATVATFSKRRGFRHSFEAEILDEAHQVLLLAAMFAIHDVRQRLTAAAVAGAVVTGAADS